MEQTISDAELATFNEFIRGTNIDYAEIAVTNGELLALYATGKELVAAPGAGYVTEFISALLILDWASTQYDTNGDLTVRETNKDGTALSDTVDLADFLNKGADHMVVLQALSADETLAENKALVLSAATGNPSTGNSLVRVKIAYRIHAHGL